MILSRNLSLSEIVCQQSSGKHKIGLIQVTCKADKTENFETMKGLIREAKEKGASMVFLPEACDYIETSIEASIKKGETLDGPFISSYQKLAAELKIWISLGSFHRKAESNSNEAAPNKCYNTSVILDDIGKIKCVHDKLHLFEANIKGAGDVITSLKEADYTFQGGDLYLPVETPVGAIGTCICYDLRFPQLSTLLRKMGAQILTYPSVFTIPTGKAHWEVLLRARAIENQCYVIASAQVGQHNEKRASYGHSMVVDPWGKVLADCGETSPCVAVVEIDLDYLRDVRVQLPVESSTRHDLYPQIPVVRKKISQEFYQFGPDIKLANEVVFLETQYSIAFVNLRPIVPGHVVLIPKAFRARVIDMTNEEALDLFHTARYVASRLESHYGGTSLNFGIQDGPESGQSVMHIHMHIIPRHKGDFRKDEIYDRLRNHDKDPSVNGRSFEEMRDEAAVLRKLFGYV